MKKVPADKNLQARLRVFADAGLIEKVPTDWQLFLGQLEMAPYVVMPDEGDAARYAGAPLGHPLLRTPVVFSQIGWEHMRVGHGLHSSLKAVVLHIAYVFHEGMPSFDLQLVQTHPDGLETLRDFLAAIDDPARPESRRHKRLIDLVLPKAEAYRRAFTERGGYIDRALAFDYPTAEEVAPFLRPEFTDLCRFVAYCERTFPASPRVWSPGRSLATIADLSTRAVRERLAA